MLEMVLGTWSAGIVVAATSVMTMLISNLFREPVRCARPHGEVVYRPTRGLGLAYAIAEVSTDEVPFYQARHRAKEGNEGLARVPAERGDGG
jgi:hypothetical protein